MAQWVVLGSNSFSASHFIARLLRDGQEVVGISRSVEVDQVFRSYAWEDSAGAFEFAQIDMTDSIGIANLLFDTRPDIVVNFAAQSMVAESWKSPEDWYRTNVLGVVELAKTLESLTGLDRYVHVSTPEVYGSTAGWVSESRGFYPSTPYAVSRAAADMHLYALHVERGFPVCFTRAANVYGPGQQVYRIIPRSFLYARLGRQLRLDGGGRSTRSFIHIDDVAAATYLVAQNGVPGESYHLSTPEIVSIREVVKRACELAEVSFDDLVVEGPERPGKDDSYMLNSTKIQRELGWESTISLEVGMRNTLEWIDANLSALSAAPDFYVHKK